MVKVERKPFEEIKSFIKKYKKILNIGCGGCASVCLGGGQKEVNALNTELNLTFKSDKLPTRVDGYTVERACNLQYLVELDEIVKEYDCLITMACGAGAQLLAEKFSDRPVFPAVNTIAIGIDRDIGVYEEKCRACGDCVLGYTGGICPVTRCAKSLFNGPCGGVSEGKCEINPMLPYDVPCAWCDIYERLEKQDRLEDILKIHPPAEWENQIQRTIVQEPYQNRYFEKY
ncbi:MAG: hypothetical protein B6I22_10315 [Desulfobacteraceae bacterium 4572_123]|nr:MAG: hypothetical protein B6I22_10315 [Desulfobacteraceae bacterium 4572_123]